MIPIVLGVLVTILMVLAIQVLARWLTDKIVG